VIPRSKSGAAGDRSEFTATEHKVIDAGRVLYYDNNNADDPRSNKDVFDCEMKKRKDTQGMTGAQRQRAEDKAKIAEKRKDKFDAKELEEARRQSVLQKRLDEKKRAKEAEQERYQGLSPAEKAKEDAATKATEDAQVKALKQRLVVDEAHKLSLVDFCRDSNLMFKVVVVSIHDINLEKHIWCIVEYYITCFN
jgi:hypothetical protein